MRKLLTGAVIASASLALAGAAVAQVTSTDGTTTLDAPCRPKKAGTKNKPKSTTLRTELTVSQAGHDRRGHRAQGVGKGSSSAARASRSATIDDLIARRHRPPAPSGSEGRPEGHARPRSSSRAAPPLDFEVYPVRRRTRTRSSSTSNGINGNGVQTAIKGKITNKGRTLRDHDPARAAPAGRPRRDADAIDADVQGQGRQERDRLQHGLQERQAQGHGHARVRRRARTAPRAPRPSRSPRR